MASRPTNSSTTHPPTQPAQPPRPPNEANPLYPPQLPVGNVPAEDDAPPSYEDAMADEIMVADGPRREYSGVTDENAPGLEDEKGGGTPRYSAQQGNPGPGGPGRGGVV
jgi:hypothetical protein